MEKEDEKKVSRQEQRKTLLDSFMRVDESGRMKDFYDYIKESIAVLDALSETDRVFFEWLKKKYRENLTEDVRESRISVQEYINWGAHKLAAEMEDLERWYVGEKWTLPEKQEYWPEIWKRTLKQWWEEDAIPTMADKKVKCSPRDVIMYFLMVMEFTVEESDEFLEMLNLNKDSSKLRKLYTLDFKEGFFRWIMRWNENHPSQKISYKKACDLYVKYGANLLDYVKKELEEFPDDVIGWIGGTREKQQVEADIEALIKILNNDSRQEKFPKAVKKWVEEMFYGDKKEMQQIEIDIKDLIESLNNCSQIRDKLPAEAEMLYQTEYAEKLKRAFAVLVHAKRRLKRICEDWKNLKCLEINSVEQRIQDIRDKNQNTTVDRGTEYAWKQLELLADKKQNDFGAAFDKFMNCSSGFISEAYWRQFSVLMDLYGKSGGASEEHEPYIKKIRFSAATDEPKMYKDVQLFPKRGRTVLSFGYDSKDITSAINSGTANGTYLSSLMRPVLRNSNDMFAKGPVKSMSALSALWNNYNAWCKGEKEPYVSYKRDVILKLALASSVYNQADLHKVMSLAGSSNFNYLDRKEAMVYLVVRYREELHQQIKNMNDAISVVEDKGWGTPGAMKAFKRMKDVAKSLPPEYLAGRPDCLKEKSELPGTNDKAVVQDAIKWWRLTVNDKRVPSVIEYIRKSDLLRIRFGASSETADEIREKFFYGPYSGDFVKETGKNRSGVSEETSWVQMECEIFRLMEEVLSEAGVRFVFELWHEDVIWRTFAGISPSCWYQECDLVEMRLEEIEEAMIEALEDAGISTETMSGQCADVEACLDRLHAVAAQTGFMKQNPNALETEYLLEQWFYVLAAMRVLGIPTGDSIERLKEYVFYWVIIGGVNNFKYANYRKERGFSSVEEMAKDKLSDKHWEHQQENYKLIRERWKKDFRFWERVYFDYMAICVSVDWMKVNHPESYSLYALMLRELRQKIKEDQVNDEIREKLFSKKGGNQPFSNMKSEWKLACSNAEYFLKLHKTGTEEYKALEKQVKVLKQRYEQFFDDVERAND